MKYQHVPIIIDAIQYDGSFSGAQAVSALLTANGISGGVTIAYDNGSVKSLVIPDGGLKDDEAERPGRTVSIGHWVYVTREKEVKVLHDSEFNETFKVVS